MKDYELAALRWVGAGLVVLAAIVGAATCGDQYGRDHAGEKP